MLTCRGHPAEPRARSTAEALHMHQPNLYSRKWAARVVSVSCHSIPGQDHLLLPQSSWWTPPQDYSQLSVTIKAKPWELKQDKSTTYIPVAHHLMKNISMLMQVDTNFAEHVICPTVCNDRRILLATIWRLLQIYPINEQYGTNDLTELFSPAKFEEPWIWQSHLHSASWRHKIPVIMHVQHS
jgi:hypothetical protein